MSSKHNFYSETITSSSKIWHACCSFLLHTMIVNTQFLNSNKSNKSFYYFISKFRNANSFLNIYLMENIITKNNFREKLRCKNQ